mmetsp:Transcript_32011/g.71133  ORF Transcript_32011/g.71133 Transcript_32011/m.71133 type:complete len:534 (-) Transcript_32011:285-1886(-)
MVPNEGIPVPLIIGDGKKLQCTPDGLKLLRSIRHPVAVVAVCGRARTGKSYILNQLLGRSSGFVVSSSYKPQTRGIWLWSSPVELRDSVSNEPFYLVLLDTEGIDAYNQTTQDGVQLFCLAVLLSSLFVFNQMGPIDEAALDRLSLVTEITKRVRARATGGDDDLRGLSEFSPTFMWLLRDFYFSLERDDGVQVSARDYLETALMPSGGSGPAVEAKNAIRASIKALFPDRDCFTLVRPVADEAQLRLLDTLEQGELRPEFTKGVSELTSRVLAKALPKRMGTQLVSGPILAGLAEAYVRAINEGAVPTISTAWQGVAEAECRAAAYAAEDAYRATFNEGVPPDEVSLLTEHQRALRAAGDVFKRGAVGDKQLRTTFKEQWRKTCEGSFAMFRDARLARAAADVDAQLLVVMKAMQNAGRTGDVATIAAQSRRAISAYDSATCGPTKWVKLVEVLQDQWPGLAEGLVQRKADECQVEVERLSKEVLQMKEMLQAAAKQMQEQEAAAGASRSLPAGYEVPKQAGCLGGCFAGAK